MEAETWCRVSAEESVKLTRLAVDWKANRKFIDAAAALPVAQPQSDRPPLLCPVPRFTAQSTSVQTGQPTSTPRALNHTQLTHTHTCRREGDRGREREREVVRGSWLWPCELTKNREPNRTWCTASAFSFSWAAYVDVCVAHTHTLIQTFTIFC